MNKMYRMKHSQHKNCSAFLLVFLFFLCNAWKISLVASFVLFKVRSYHHQRQQGGVSHHDGIVFSGRNHNNDKVVVPSGYSKVSVVLHAKKSNNKDKGSGKKGTTGTASGIGGGGGSGTLSRKKSGITKKDDHDDDDYVVFPRLEPNVQKTLVESTQDDRENAKDLSVEIYQRLDQIYGFPDFNFPPDWFRQDVSGGNDNDDNSNIDDDEDQRSWQDLLMKSSTMADQPSWIAADVDSTGTSTRDEKDKGVKVKVDVDVDVDVEALDEIQNLPPFTKFRVLHVDPMVLAIDDFFTEDECDQYIEMCCKTQTGSGKDNKGHNDEDGDENVAPILSTRSKTVGKDSRSMAQRTSTTWFHHYRGVPALMAKASRLMGLRNIDRWEEPQTVRYRQTEKFTWHLDALAPSGDLIQNGGQRVATLLVYLSNIDEKHGGSTVFRDLRYDYGGTGAAAESGKEAYLKMRPQKGSALLFFPAAGGVPNTPFDIRTLHAGEAMAPDAPTDKWIAQLWLRENELYKPNAPPGNSRELAFGAIRDYCNRNRS